MRWTIVGALAAAALGLGLSAQAVGATKFASAMHLPGDSLRSQEYFSTLGYTVSSHRRRDGYVESLVQGCCVLTGWNHGWPALAYGVEIRYGDLVYSPDGRFVSWVPWSDSNGMCVQDRFSGRYMCMRE